MVVIWAVTLCLILLMLLWWRQMERADERWAWMDSELLVLYNRALKRYPALLEQLQSHMQTGEPLGEDFAPTFG